MVSTNKRTLILQYFLRRCGVMILFMFAAVLMAVLVFEAFAPSAVKAHSAMKRAKATDAREIVVTGEKNDLGEDFCLLDASSLLVSAAQPNVRLSCDSFVIIPGEQYADNYLRFSGTLQQGTCAVSENLMRERGLSVGDEILLRGTSFRFRIAQALRSQRGLDSFTEGGADRDGVIVLAYDKDMLAACSYRFVSFAHSADVYYDLIQRYFVKDIYSASRNSYLQTVGIGLLVLLAFLLLGEALWWSLRQTVYRIMWANGVARGALFGRLFLHAFLRYILPFCLVALFEGFKFVSFLAQYVVFAFLTLGFVVIVCLINVSVQLWRLTQCRKPK